MKIAKRRRGTANTAIRKRGYALTPADREFVYQTYYFVENGNAAATADRCGVTVRTVYSVIKDFANKPADVQKAHAGMASRMQAKTMAKAEQVLDSITGTDLESGYFEIKNADGEVVGRRYYGPQATQKALAFGIITDKAQKYAELVKANLADERAGQLLIPQDIDGLKDAILSKISSLKIAQIDFKHDAPGVLEQTQDLLARVEAAKATEVEIVDDFANDNPGRAQG